MFSKLYIFFITHKYCILLPFILGSRVLYINVGLFKEKSYLDTCRSKQIKISFSQLQLRYIYVLRNRRFIIWCLGTLSLWWVDSSNNFQKLVPDDEIIAVRYFCLNFCQNVTYVTYLNKAKKPGPSFKTFKGTVSKCGILQIRGQLEQCKLSFRLFG